MFYSTFRLPWCPKSNLNTITVLIKTLVTWLLLTWTGASTAHGPPLYCTKASGSFELKINPENQQKYYKNFVMIVMQLLQRWPCFQRWNTSSRISVPQITERALSIILHYWAVRGSGIGRGSTTAHASSWQSDSLRRHHFQ